MVIPVLLYRIFLNLLNNSLEQIAKNGHGEIFISSEADDKYNYLHFRDTAGGAPAYLVAHLFDGFNTTKEKGTGVGLAFCKLTMKSFDGDIICHSIEGDYMEFVLSFPILFDE
ncbi:MAG: ATP-binding protein [Gammaproteobacteria bacterium]